MTKRRFTKEFKLQVIQEVDSGKAIEQVGREHEVHPSTLRRWRWEHQQHGAAAFAGKGNTYKLEAKNAELERAIGELYVENRFLKKALEKLQDLERKGN